jgi:antitoxin component of RelBE/YafQ-DinJ toxin-antitoxin module
MAKLKKPIPDFKTEQEAERYWDTHSVLEHFDESDFERLNIKRAKDHPIAIRLDSKLRSELEEMAEALNIGPSTLARTLIVETIRKWKGTGQPPITLDQASGALTHPLPDELKKQVVELFQDAKAGDLLLLQASELDRLNKLILQCIFEAAGFKIISDSKAQNHEPTKSEMVNIHGS